MAFYSRKDNESLRKSISHILKYNIENFQGGKTTVEKIIFFLLIVFLLTSAFSIAISQTGYIGALVIWLGYMVYTRKYYYPQTGLELFILFYVLAEVLSTIFSTNIHQSIIYMQRRIIIIPIIFIIIANSKSLQDVRRLFVALLLSIVLVSLWSMLNIVSHFNEYIHFTKRLSEFQIYMTTGGIMMIGLLLLLPFALQNKIPARIRILSSLALIPVGISLIFTFTRSSWLGFIGGAVFVGIMRARKVLFVIGMIILLVIVFSPPEVQSRIFSIVDLSHQSNASRLHMWKTGLKMFLDYPIFGIGDVGTEVLWSKYAEPGWQPEGHLHNNLIMWLVTLGIVGFIAITALFVKISYLLFDIEKKVRDDWFCDSLAIGGSAALIGFHINGLFEWNYGDAEIIMMIWAIIGLNFAAYNNFSQIKDM